jgi:hypothetical protein
MHGKHVVCSSTINLILSSSQGCQNVLTNLNWMKLLHNHVPFYIQKFTNLIIQRFQNINFNKEGLTLKSTSNLKNEIRIMTVANNGILLRHPFLEKHASDAVIHLNTGFFSNKTKAFKVAVHQSQYKQHLL